MDVSNYFQRNEATHQYIGESGRQVAVSALYNSAKLAAATTTSLCTSSKLANASLRDNEGRGQLAEASKTAAVAVQHLVATLRGVTHTAPEANRGSTFTKLTATDLLKDGIMQAAEKFAPVAYKLVTASKNVGLKVENPEAKQDLVYCSISAAKAIHKMLANRKAMKGAEATDLLLRVDEDVTHYNEVNESEVARSEVNEGEVARSFEPSHQAGAGSSPIFFREDIQR